jgi:hypothetical protein
MNPRSLLFTLSILLLPFLSVSAAVPGVHVPGASYSTGDLVIYNGTTYLAQQDVSNSQDPSGSDAWSSLDEIAVDQVNPGDRPDMTPDKGDLLGLSVPDGNETNGTGGTGSTPTFNPGYRRDGSAMDPSIPSHFDVDGYYDRNHDVRDVFQNLADDGVLAYNHYMTDGVLGDLMFNNDFVPLEYLNIYVDLKVLFTNSEGVTDLVAAVNHWFDYGRAEGRLGRFQKPTWFDAQAYRDTHHDIRDAFAGSSFGEDTEAWWHFYRIGAPLEGRSFDDTQFNLDAYIASNPDLKVFFRRSDGKIDKKAAMYHYISDGHAEGRVDSFSVPSWFDVQEYKTNNPDVAASSAWNTSDFLTFNHFYRFGAPLENRVLSNFNLTHYIELNVDIANFYGSSTTDERRECMIHYMSDGFSEGRAALK